jgi:hypothetical protein
LPEPLPALRAPCTAARPAPRQGPSRNSAAPRPLAGATGFIGSLVLELLLRTTDVARVYALCRGKRGASARERLQRLLHSGLFHRVRDSPELLEKVGCGVSVTSQAVLCGRPCAVQARGCKPAAEARPRPRAGPAFVPRARAAQP